MPRDRRNAAKEIQELREAKNPTAPAQNPNQHIQNGAFFHQKEMVQRQLICKVT